MNNNANVQAREITDIRDKKQLYLIIENENGKLVINVGKSTFEAATKLTNQTSDTNAKKTGK